MLAPAHPDALLLMVGPRHDLNRPELADFRREIQSIRSTPAVANRLRFTGPVDNVADYLKASDLLVFTSRREGMPNVIPEAMASGLPVVTTPFIGFPEEFGSAGREFILSSWNPEDLASDVVLLLGSRAEREDLGQRARAWVTDRLALGASLDQYRTLYRKLSASRQADRRATQR